MVVGLTAALKDQMRAVFGDAFRDAGPAWPHLAYSLTVLVTDVDAHFDLARQAGARIIAEPKDQPWGLRDYEAADDEGRLWNFSQVVRETKPADWGATAAPAPSG